MIRLDQNIRSYMFFDSHTKYLNSTNESGIGILKYIIEKMIACYLKIRD